jgi:hypothetical protein
MCYEYEWYEKARLAEQARKSREPSKDERKRAETPVPGKQAEPRPAKQPLPA